MDVLGVTRSQQGAPLALDRKHLARYTLGNAALEAEILDLFIQQAPQTISRLIEAGNPKQWKEAAHTLKGSARAVGAWRLAETAEACEANGGPGGDQTLRCLADVHTAFTEVQALIAEICEAAAALAGAA